MLDDVGLVLRAALDDSERQHRPEQGAELAQRWGGIEAAADRQFASSVSSSLTDRQRRHLSAWAALSEPV
jgi:hypothetical protein